MNQVVCNDCNLIFSCKQALYRHRKTNHLKKPIKIQPQPQPKFVSPEIELLRKEIQQKDNKIIEVLESVREELKVYKPVMNSNSINNSTIYFNKDLKYYPELVKIMGREKACNYLLYGMPETKDIFGVIDKLFLQNGAIGCPFRYDQDTGDFLIARAEGVFDRDPTGETIDRENKSKLQDAILSAYVDTTKHISRECADLRIARLNGEYTEADQEKLTRRFDALMTVEPIRPYEVIDLMNGLKPKKRDYDKIKKMCPAIVKKITIS